VERQRESFMPPLWLMTVAVVVGGVWLMVRLKELFVLLLVGYFLAYAIDPLVSRLERKGLSRALALSVVLFGFLAALVLAAVTAIPTIIDEFQKLSDNLSSYIATSKDKIGPLLERGKALLPDAIQGKIDFDDLTGSIMAMLSQVSGETIKKIGNTVMGTLMHGYSRALTLVNVALLPFIVFYLSVDMPKLHGFFLSLFPITRRAKVGRICAEVDRYVSSFVRGQALVCSILFVLYAVGLGCIGVDLWLLLAAIAGFGNMVPYVGTISGIVLSSVMALVTFGDFSHVVWVLGVFGAVQLIDGTVITPRIMGESVGLSPLVIILALFAGGQLFGLLGIFLAIPAAATLRVLVRHSYNWARNS
jgi:predicted PurR-regulated permease PerM